MSEDGLVVASCGWGVNSVWMIVRALERGERLDVVLFSDTGVEHDDTYCVERWYREHVLEPAGVEYVRLSPWATPEWYKDDRIAGGRGLLAFCRMRTIVPLAAARWCSTVFKAEPGEAWCVAHGVTEQWLGFTEEEEKRVRRRGVWDPDGLAGVDVALPGYEGLVVKKEAKGKPWRVRAPLWEDGVRRQDCVDELRAREMVVPEKSGCKICPFAARELVRAARAGEPYALEVAELVCELELAASEASGKLVGLTPDGDRVVDLLAVPQLELGDVDVSVYRPCECAL